MRTIWVMVVLLFALWRDDTTAYGFVDFCTQSYHLKGTGCLMNDHAMLS